MKIYHLCRLQWSWHHYSPCVASLHLLRIGFLLDRLRHRKDWSTCICCIEYRQRRPWYRMGNACSCTRPCNVGMGVQQLTVRSGFQLGIRWNHQFNESNKLGKHTRGAIKVMKHLLRRFLRLKIRRNITRNEEAMKHRQSTNWNQLTGCHIFPARVNAWLEALKSVKVAPTSTIYKHNAFTLLFVKVPTFVVSLTAVTGIRRQKTYFCWC